MGWGLPKRMIPTRIFEHPNARFSSWQRLSRHVPRLTPPPEAGHILSMSFRLDDSDDLRRIATLTGLPLRKLRYVVDHELLPGMKFQIAANETGRPRRFGPDVAFGIACIATLLEGGLQSAAAYRFFDAILHLSIPWGSRQEAWHGAEILSTFIDRGKSGQALLGDGRNVRLNLQMRDGQIDTDWHLTHKVDPHRTTHTSRRSDGYSPRTLVALDLGRLRELLVSPSSSSG